MLPPDEPWLSSDLDPGRLWRGTPDPNRLQPASHPWSYRRTTMAGAAQKRERAVKPVAGQDINKPSPRRERRTNRRRGEVKAAVGVAALNADKEFCPHGHSLADAYQSLTKRGWSHRKCRTCALEKQRQKRASQPKKAQRVGPRGAAALALASPTCRRGHKWTPHTTIIRGGNGPLAGTRLCRACRNYRHDARRLEAWRADMNAKADAERERKEAEHRAFAQRRIELVRVQSAAQVEAWRRRFMLQRFGPPFMVG